jgi:hypothetical protein
MKSKILSFIFICYLIFSITLCANLASRSKGGIDSVKLAAVCMKGLADNILLIFAGKEEQI